MWDILINFSKFDKTTKCCFFILWKWFLNKHCYNQPKLLESHSSTYPKAEPALSLLSVFLVITMLWVYMLLSKFLNLNKVSRSSQHYAATTMFQCRSHVLSEEWLAYGLWFLLDSYFFLKDDRPFFLYSSPDLCHDTILS